MSNRNNEISIDNLQLPTISSADQIQAPVIVQPQNLSQEQSAVSGTMQQLLPPPSTVPQKSNSGATSTRKMLAPSSTAPQKLNTGSATGNPRNKCALKPGHSLMDWIRLGNSGVDLAGTRGRVTPVSSDELAQHNTRRDAWLAIRGKVFNVTRYMDYHPGGVDELMRGVGRDATKLFDDVHAWVNYQQLLIKCYIGPLRAKVRKDSITDVGKPPPASSKSINATTAEVVPRFDWIQKRQDLAISIYTRQLCNPGLVMRHTSPKSLQLRVQIEHIKHIFEFELHDAVVWPPSVVRVNSETGKVEVTLVKVEPALWTTYGAHMVSKRFIGHNEKDQYEYEVVKTLNFNHDSFELGLKAKKDMLMLLPIGYHVTVGAIINANLVHRSYTPFDSRFYQRHLPTTAVTDESSLSFLIKSYTSGTLSKHLRQQQSGQILLLSAPRGNFQLQRLLTHRQITLIAAGSGLTPMLNLIEHLLKRNVNRIDYLRLMYFNKTLADIWYHNELKRLATLDERFQLVNVLSEADAEWTGLRGRVCKELLEPLIAKNTTEYASFVAICGPSVFSQTTEVILKELKFDMENLHIFQG